MAEIPLPHTEETMVGQIIPEYAHTRHLLIERAHVIHLGSPFFRISSKTMCLGIDILKPKKEVVYI